MKKPKKKVAVYYDLPAGGAWTHTQDILKLLKNKFRVVEFTPTPPVANRVGRDLQSLFWSRANAKTLATELNANYGLVYVTHDRFFQAPWILRYLTIPVLFYCHEPTRAFFEKELGINRNWPLINQLYERGIRHIKKNIEISNAQHADLILTNSHYNQRVIKKVYGKESRVVYPSVDRSVFKLSKQKRHNQILIVGNGEPQKRIDLAFRALSLIDPKVRPKLIVVSPRNKLSQSYFRLAQGLGVQFENRVNITQSELIKLYQSSRLTLATALREPFGYSVVESISCGTPVVAVREGGFVETVRDGLTGVLVEPTAKDIAKGIKKLLLRRNRPDIFREPFLHRSDLRLEDAVAELISESDITET